jgi:hypothetical protein
VIIDQRVVDARVHRDLAHAERRVTLARETLERRVENLGLGAA